MCGKVARVTGNVRSGDQHNGRRADGDRLARRYGAFTFPDVRPAGCMPLAVDGVLYDTGSYSRTFALVGATRVLITSIAEEEIREIVRSPSALVGSGGNCVADCGVVGQNMPHSPFYGTFPRTIGRYV